MTSSFISSKFIKILLYIHLLLKHIIIKKVRHKNKLFIAKFDIKN